MNLCFDMKAKLKPIILESLLNGGPVKLYEFRKLEHLQPKKAFIYHGISGFPVGDINIGGQTVPFRNAQNMLFIDFDIS